MAKKHRLDYIDYITGLTSGANLGVSSAIATNSIVQEDTGAAVVASAAAIHTATEFLKKTPIIGGTISLASLDVRFHYVVPNYLEMRKF